MSGKFLRARAVCRKSYSSYVVLSGVQKQKAVKLHAKIMDSGVSRIQMWRDKKMQEKKEKREKRIMRKIARKLLQKSLKQERKSKQQRADVDGLRETNALQLKKSQRKIGVNETSRRELQK